MHFYPYNPVFETSLPRSLQHNFAKAVANGLLRRLSVGLGYIPSWASPKVQVTARARSKGQLPELVIDREQMVGWPSMFRRMSLAMLRAAPALDLWPLLSHDLCLAGRKELPLRRLISARRSQGRTWNRPTRPLRSMGQYSPS